MSKLPVDVEASENAAAHDEESHEQQTHCGDAGGPASSGVEHQVAGVLRRQRLCSPLHILLCRLKPMRRGNEIHRQIGNFNLLSDKFVKRTKIVTVLIGRGFTWKHWKNTYKWTNSVMVVAF